MLVGLGASDVQLMHFVSQESDAFDESFLPFLGFADCLSVVWEEMRMGSVPVMVGWLTWRVGNERQTATVTSGRHAFCCLIGCKHVTWLHRIIVWTDC